jgi:putative ABC transport system permease protein
MYQGGNNVMESLRQDLPLALRMLAKRPGYTLVIALTLALGIGANTAIFSFVNALLITPPPYRDPDRLVRLMSQRGAESGKLSLLEVEDLNRHTSLFEGFASFRVSQYNVTGGGPPEAIMASINSWKLFDLLGVKPVLGQTWPQSHERQSVFNIALSYDVWQRRFVGDPNIVGQKVMLDAAPYEVLGVLPPGFDFPMATGRYRRVPPGDFASRSIRESGVIARLKPGVTIEQAQAELDQLAQEWERSYPDTNAGVRFAVAPMREHWIGGASSYLWLLFGAVSFVLMIACVNVINLMLSAAITREKEMAIRAALGAGRARLIRQMLIESLLLTSIGGLLGFGLAAVCVKLMSKPAVAAEMSRCWLREWLGNKDRSWVWTGTGIYSQRLESERVISVYRTSPSRRAISVRSRPNTAYSTPSSGGESSCISLILLTPFVRSLAPCDPVGSPFFRNTAR